MIKTPAKFQKFGIKLYEELRPHVTRVIVTQLKHMVENKQKVEKKLWQDNPKTTCTSSDHE